jgi:hypothetical protein
MDYAIDNPSKCEYSHLDNSATTYLYPCLFSGILLIIVMIYSGIRRLCNKNAMPKVTALTMMTSMRSNEFFMSLHT